MTLTDAERLYRAVPEADVLRNVMRHIAWRGGYALRLNTGAAAAEYNGKRRFIRFSEPGAPDIIAIMPGGRTLYIECKRELGLQSADQRAWQYQVESRGATYLICRPSTYAEVIDAALL